VAFAFASSRLGRTPARRTTMGTPVEHRVADAGTTRRRPPSYTAVRSDLGMSTYPMWTRSTAVRCADAGCSQSTAPTTSIVF
jgi:hypothetical protein